jgi:predicted transposase YdaD
VVERLPSKHEALSSEFSPWYCQRDREKEGRKEGREGGRKKGRKERKKRAGSKPVLPKKKRKRKSIRGQPGLHSKTLFQKKQKQTNKKN